MNAKRGSTILFILLLMMMVSISFVNRMRSASYLLDIAQKREQFEEQYYATQTLLTIGIIYASKIGVKEKMSIISIDTNQWLPNNNKCSGTVKINKKGPLFFIESCLKKNNIPICSLSCNLSKEESNQLFDGTKRKPFIISNFQYVFSGV